jgi:hypothetical protein
LSRSASRWAAYRGPKVQSFLPPPDVDAELAWFFNEATLAMGESSNFERVVGTACGRNDYPSPEAAAEATHAHRQIRSWLLAIPDADAGVLRAAYEERPWPLRLSDELGRLTGIVVRLACALDAWPDDRASQELLETVRAGWLEGQLAAVGPGRPMSALIGKLRPQAELRFASAVHAYSVVRGHGPSVLRGLS